MPLMHMALFNYRYREWNRYDLLHYMLKNLCDQYSYSNASKQCKFKQSLSNIRNIVSNFLIWNVIRNLIVCKHRRDSLTSTARLADIWVRRSRPSGAWAQID